VCKDIQTCLLFEVKDNAGFSLLTRSNLTAFKMVRTILNFSLMAMAISQLPVHR